ncbi:hypothetical protein CFter6_0537 [Collimonas fungivorans]|uniref:Uncharacterized protein n=1 Tax=Collimonas fungivorans TaxID=158899 RepID=A0A127P621_9BURK|nr:hypothetical protein CFter6_0537 [Collimonas fungivorans]
MIFSIAFSHFSNAAFDPISLTTALDATKSLNWTQWIHGPID